MIYEERMKFLREDAELTQEDIAKILNISRGSYSLYEIEYVIIPIKHLITICNYFKVSLDYMLSFTEKNNFKKCKPEIDKTISGERLKNLRKEKGLTQKELAKILNVAKTIISEYEKGNFIISTHSLYTICKNYNISADYLLGRIDRKIVLK